MRHRYERSATSRIVGTDNNHHSMYIVMNEAFSATKGTHVSDETQEAHNIDVRDQFTKQAVAFAEKHRSHETALSLLLEVVGPTSDDTVLDVACGPGLVSCAFAQVVEHVTGVDLTPAMLDQAKRLQIEKGLQNMTWDIANAESLPYTDAAFSLVVSRYTFHHFLDPKIVLSEMKRVCHPNGKVIVIDVAPEPGKVAAFNHMEKLRDPSHVKAMSAIELTTLVRDAGFASIDTRFYGWEVEVEKQLRASFPKSGDEHELRRIFVEDLATNSLGMGAHRRGNEIYVSYPTVIIVGDKLTD